MENQDRIALALERIATALEAQSPAPDLVLDLAQYPGFDWASIGAEMVQRDTHGAIAVRYQGKIYTRRNPVNKYGVAIWYSRATGKDGEATVYERLATFKEVKVEADPLSDKTVQLLRRLRDSR